jgi:ABC-type lipoprotein release transport system permease subunit
MRGALYLRRGTGRQTWRAVLALALIGGLLGAVALAALAGARRTAGSYGRYLVASKASDAFINVPGLLPGMPALEPVDRISRLPEVTTAASYIGLNCVPLIGGRLKPGFLTNGLDGSLGEYFSQNKLTVLAGKLPPASATDQIVLSPAIARFFGVGVGGTVTYRFDNRYGGTVTPAPVPPVTRSFRVAAIVDVPPVLVDQADIGEGAIVPPAATRQLARFYQYAWIGVRLAHGTAGVPALQRQLSGLSRQLGPVIARAIHQPAPDLTFNILDSATVRRQVRQALAPQEIALAVFGAVAGLALLVLAGQGMTQLLSRPAAALPAARAMGATRGQTGLAVALPGLAALAGAVVAAVAGAYALSPLAPVGPVRRFDPARGFHADPLVLGAGGAALAVLLAGVLALAARRVIRRAGGAGGAGGVTLAEPRPSVIARAAGSAGLPAAAVVGSRNAVANGAMEAVPGWVTVLGSVAAVTAVVATAVFGTSLTRLVTHPREYGWDWDVLLQAEGGYGNFHPEARLDRLVDGQPGVAAWSTFGFSQIPVGGRITPVIGVGRHRGSVLPPTAQGRPLAADGEIELGAVTMRELGAPIGSVIQVGLGPHQIPLRVVGTVTLPSFGVAGAEHVSLGRGAMMSEDDLVLAVGGTPGSLQPGSAAATVLPSAAAIDLAPGTTAAQRTALVRRITSANPDGTPGGTYELSRPLAAEVSNASGMSGQPLALAVGLAVAAVLSLGLTVLAGVRRRRRELALLKTLGMTRRQVRAIVAWQTTVTLVLAVAAGLPLGLALGRWAWQAFAGSLGVVPVTAVPALALVAGTAALLIAGNVLTALPGRVAARTAPAVTLRAG